MDIIQIQFVEKLFSVNSPLLMKKILINKETEKLGHKLYIATVIVYHLCTLHYMTVQYRKTF